ncbi:MAG: sigma-54-dependent transcriptional regulator [Planctomycetota bacterium]
MIKTREDNAEQVRCRPETTSVLIVDSDRELTRSVLRVLAHKGIRGTVATNKKAALGLLSKHNYDLVLTSGKISPQAGLPGRPQCAFELLNKITSASPELPVIMMAEADEQSARDTQRIIEMAVKAIRHGCCDFLMRPLGADRIETLLDTLVPSRSVSTIASADDSSAAGHDLYRIVGRSPKLLQIVGLAKKIAPTSVPVLVTGESGTGKELISYLIHSESRRAQGRYVRVNCAALSDTLLESELFGHERGAFTDAHVQRKGRFEMAHGGTLLLDEIAETPIRFQAKLLRVLEQQNFERVGGNENIRVDVRIISTSNRNLLQEVQQGRFRRDLYYRLSGVRLIIPPLRERTEDLPDLVWHFVNQYAREVQRRIIELDPAMMDMFARYHWPGNIRQLKNAVLTSLILGVGEKLSLADVSWLFDELQPLPQERNSGAVGQEHDTRAEATQLPRLGGVPLVQVERQAILETLRQTAGNQTKAAKVLGISDRTLRDKIRRYRKQGCLESV